METINHLLVPIEPGTTSATDRAFSGLMTLRKGWASWRPALFDLSPRWQWWSLALLTKSLPPLPYPKIEFAASFPDHAAPMRMIRECLDGQERRFEDLLDYLLFCFGSSDQREMPRRVALEDLRYWRKILDLKVLMDHPGDWLGAWYETHEASRSFKGATGFFSTPPALCRLMVELTLQDAKLTDSVHEPCVGSGRILLEASNRVLNLSGMDVNPTLVKICQVNSWLYMPSAALPLKAIETQTKPFQMDRKIINTFKRSLTYG